jgi:hypothetical protein
MVEDHRVTDGPRLGRDWGSERETAHSYETGRGAWDPLGYARSFEGLLQRHGMEAPQIVAAVKQALAMSAP